jgi:hypothetical protein
MMTPDFMVSASRCCNRSISPRHLRARCRLCDQIENVSRPVLDRDGWARAPFSDQLDHRAMQSGVLNFGAVHPSM